MHRSPAPFLLPLLLACPAHGQISPHDSNTLYPGISLTRTLARGNAVRFPVRLEGEQLAHVVVDQRGVDLILRVFGADGRSIGEFDSPNGAFGPEPAKFVARTPGVYFVDVAPFLPDGAVSTPFDIRLVEVRGATELELRAARRPEDMKRRGIALLSTIAGMLPEIRSLPTRIRYQIRTIQTLRSVDENAARGFAMDAAATAREFLRMDIPDDADDHTRLYAPAQIRQEFFNAVVAFDPELALEFLYSTRPPEPEAGRNGHPDPDLQLEMQAATAIASKDSRRAYEVAQQALDRGYPSQLGSLIGRIRSSEPVLAARLTRDALAKLREVSLVAAPDAAGLAVGLLHAAQQSRQPASRSAAAGADVPLLGELDLRNLMGRFLQEGLSVEVGANAYTPEYNAARSLLQALKSMPEAMRSLPREHTALIEERLALLNAGGDSRGRIYHDAINNSPVEEALETISRAPYDLRDNLYNQIASKLAATDPARARQIVTGFIVNPQQRHYALTNVERQALQHAMNTGRLEEALEVIRSIRSRRERVNLVTQLLYRVGQRQKAEAAVNTLEQARALVSVSPWAEDQDEINALLQIAGTYARFDAEKGFHIVEPLVGQFNDLAIAAEALNGFGQQFYVDGELSMTNGNSLGNIANQIVETLAKLSAVDFDRAKNSLERIQRPEVRVAGYLSIARQAIGGAQTGMHTGWGNAGGISVITR